MQRAKASIKQICCLLQKELYRSVDIVTSSLQSRLHLLCRSRRKHCLQLGNHLRRRRGCRARSSTVKPRQKMSQSARCDTLTKSGLLPISRLVLQLRPPVALGPRAACSECPNPRAMFSRTDDAAYQRQEADLMLSLRASAARSVSAIADCPGRCSCTMHQQ